MASCPAAVSSPPIVQRRSHGSPISRLTLPRLLPSEACWGDGFVVVLYPFEAHFVYLLNSLGVAMLFTAFISSLGKMAPANHLQYI